MGVIAVVGNGVLVCVTNIVTSQVAALGLKLSLPCCHLQADAEL